MLEVWRKFVEAWAIDFVFVVTLKKSVFLAERRAYGKQKKNGHPAIS